MTKRLLPLIAIAAAAAVPASATAATPAAQHLGGGTALPAVQHQLPAVQLPAVQLPAVQR